MEMIDVLKKLQEITDKSPEVAKAVENVKATNPKEVKENAVESEPAITEYKVGSYKDFLASKGIDIYKLKGDEHSKYAQLYKAEKERAHADATTHKGTDDHREISRIMKHEDEPTKEGGMSDVHIGAQEKVGEFIDADGNLSAPKQDVLQSLEQQRASAPFPESYEIETAIKMVQDDFDDNGQANAEYEPDPEDSIPHDVDTQMNMDAPAEEQPIKEAPNPKKEAMQTLEALRDMVMELPITDDAKTSAHTALDQVSDDIMMDVATDEEATAEPQEELNTTTKAPEDKKPIKEAVQISTDSPEEAGMMMQILKLAGVKPMGADMPSTEIPTNDPDADADHGEENHDHSQCPVCADDEMGSGEMGRMRDVVTAPDEEKAEETFDNEPDVKVQDTDSLVNTHSGGLNKQKQQVRKEYPGDNPLAVKYETAEDKITQENLTNSLRTQYEGFKKSYQEAAKATESKAKPDFLDMDKDGNKKEPMKKAVSDKKSK